MDPILIGALGVSFLFSATAAVVFANKLRSLKAKYDESIINAKTLEASVASLSAENQSLKASVVDATTEAKDLLAKVSERTTEVRHLEEKLAEQKQALVESSSQLTEKFEVLSNRILESQSDRFEKLSQNKLQGFLGPLKEQLSHFEKKVEETHQQDIRDRTALQMQLRHLAEANSSLITEASNLARAFKGNSKTQGNWGEVMLERILESAGLREGQEYIREANGLALQDDAGRNQRPDVIINLPDEKHIIIDSKVSLIAYERFVNIEDDAQRQQAMKEHIDSIERHVSQLAGKHYAKNAKLNTPDFVLMFMPVESALSAALLAKPEIFQTAWSKGVIIASPTTLIATAQTVSSIWRMENQNQNALKIADQGAKLFDKFVGFVEDMEQTKKSIDTLGKNFDAAMNKLSEGKGNLISSAEKLRKLGVNARKKLDKKYTEETDDAIAALTKAEQALLGASKD